jgi:hypothetical protein
MASITNNLKNKWYAGDKIVFSGTVSNLPSGADPTDYTISFELTRNDIILDTMTDVLDASANYSISHELAATVTGGTNVTVHVKLTWDTDSDYVDSFERAIFSRPAAA